jgi:hypothetical protein
MNTAFPRECHNKLILTVTPGYPEIFQNAVPHVEEVIKLSHILNNNINFCIVISPFKKKYC